MELSRNVNNRDMVNLRKLAACDEIFNNFINDLKNHEKNEAESLKKINDTIEGLLRSSGLKIDLANFQKLGSSEITVSLEKLAEKFEKALEKAKVREFSNLNLSITHSSWLIFKETGLSALVESIKETILRLRQLSETDLESNLMDDDNDLVIKKNTQNPLKQNNVYRSCLALENNTFPAIATNGAVIVWTKQENGFAKNAKKLAPVPKTIGRWFPIFEDLTIIKLLREITRGFQELEEFLSRRFPINRNLWKIL